MKMIYSIVGVHFNDAWVEGVFDDYDEAARHLSRLQRDNDELKYELFSNVLNEEPEF